MIQSTSITSFMMLLGSMSMFLFFLIKSHILKMLLSLELFMLNTVMILTLVNSFFMLSPFTIFVYFTLSVCEASIGVSILMGLIRKMGNESMNSFW